MNYIYEPSVVVKMKQQETRFKKRPLRKSFLKSFVLFIIVMVLGLLVGYISYVKLGIYSPKNLLCFMVGNALFCMGFLQLFLAIGKYVDSCENVANGFKETSTLWSPVAWCGDLGSLTGEMREVDKGYFLRLVGSGIHECTLDASTVSGVFLNRDQTQAEVTLKSICSGDLVFFMVADGLFKTSDGVDLTVKDFVKHLSDCGVDRIYVKDTEFLVSGDTCSFKLWGTEVEEDGFDNLYKDDSVDETQKDDNEVEEEEVSDDSARKAPEVEIKSEDYAYLHESVETAETVESTETESVEETVTEEVTTELEEAESKTPDIPESTDTDSVEDQETAETVESVEDDTVEEKKEDKQ